MYTEPKEWHKKIRTEIQHLRQAHSKAMKKNNRITSGLARLGACNGEAAYRRPPVIARKAERA